jgi:catechol 2,3-dioxygenase-like lactoylglutathione lyase family enzyme
VNQKEVRTKFSRPTAELPVADVERAQQHYRDALGFEIGWLYPGKEIGAVSRDDVAIFFRRRSQPLSPPFIGCLHQTSRPRTTNFAL